MPDFFVVVDKTVVQRSFIDTLSPTSFFVFGEKPQAEIVVTPVTVALVSPLGELVSRLTPIVLAINHGASSPLIRTIVYFRFSPGGASKVAYVDGEFLPGFSGHSTAVDSAGLLTLTLVPDAGWEGSPEVYVHAQNDSGGST